MEAEQERHALGLALSKRLDDVFQIQLSRGGAPPSASSASVTATRSFCTWLMTGKADVPGIGEFTRQGASDVAQEQMSLRAMMKLTLAWRDAVTVVLREEAARLQLHDDTVLAVVAAANTSCDAFTVQFAAQYDRERDELQAELVESRAQLVHKATHDPLTGLANRSFFFDHLGALCEAPARDTSAVVVVLFVDLDNFKLVNDRFGHATGDRVLKSVAERLRSVIRPQDMLSRLGGDEFVILCGGIDDGVAEDIAMRVENRIKSAFVAPFRVGETTISLSASVGITVDRSAEGNPEDIVAAADAAMYAAKARGKTLETQGL